MSYNITATVKGNFDDVVKQVVDALKVEGFGVLTEIDVKATMKLKLDIDFRNYKILGACNPTFAHKALSIEENLGVLLPCNFAVQEVAEGEIRISAINPEVSMQAVGNMELASVAGEVTTRLRRVISGLGE